MFSLICAWINGSEINREASDLRRHRAHYDVTVVDSVFHPSVYCFRNDDYVHNIQDVLRWLFCAMNIFNEYLLDIVRFYNHIGWLEIKKLIVILSIWGNISFVDIMIPIATIYVCKFLKWLWWKLQFANCCNFSSSSHHQYNPWHISSYIF